VTVPLERALSKLGLATRSEARRLVLEGRVRVDGVRATDPLTPVVPERIHITIDGRAREAPDRMVIALHKPRGVVTTRRDPEGRRTVYDLLHDNPHHVVPVGRLDYATSGLLLLTNDTRLADWLTDPVNAVPRVYLVTVRGLVTEEDADQLRHGIAVESDLLRANAVTIRKSSARETHLVIELTEGKNREVRRLLKAIGREVTRLRRVQFGGLTLGTLAPGQWRIVDDAELRKVFGKRFSENKLPARARRR
jgi:23S rRNA pseudouridine2605 synthase